MLNNRYMITNYKGFTLIKGNDWKFHVYDGKRFVLTAEDLKQAQIYILGILRISKKVQVVAEETQEKCVKCDSVNLVVIYENNGYTHPNGPQMIEGVGVSCLDCGHKEYD